MLQAYSQINELQSSCPFLPSSRCSFFHLYLSSQQVPTQATAATLTQLHYKQFKQDATQYEPQNP